MSAEGSGRQYSALNERQLQTRWFFVYGTDGSALEAGPRSGFHRMSAAVEEERVDWRLSAAAAGAVPCSADTHPGKTNSARERVANMG